MFSKFWSEQRWFLLLCSLKEEEGIRGLTCPRMNECHPLLRKMVISRRKGKRGRVRSPLATLGGAWDAGTALAI